MLNKSIEVELQGVRCCISRASSRNSLKAGQILVGYLGEAERLEVRELLAEFVQKLASKDLELATDDVLEVVSLLSGIAKRVLMYDPTLTEFFRVIEVVVQLNDLKAILDLGLIASSKRRAESVGN